MRSFIESESPPLDHLQRLTDDCGLIQHARYGIPDYASGYTTDDNARALIVAAIHHQLFKDDLSLALANRYLAFLLFAQKPDGRFRNFFSYDRRPLDRVGSEDTLGRCLWALAHLCATVSNEALLGPAEEMLRRALPWVTKLEHPLGKALSLRGLYWVSRLSKEDESTARQLARPLADALVAGYEKHCRPDWQWLMPAMTYGNAKLPEALFRSYQILEKEKYLNLARKTMAFLVEKTYAPKHFCAIGNMGWYVCGRAPALYDQQPIEAAAMVGAALTAYEVTGEIAYLRRARWAWEWFLGRNSIGVPLFDRETGGCFDGLMADGVNRNRGAESTVVMLLARLWLLEAYRKAILLPSVDARILQELTI